MTCNDVMCIATRTLVMGDLVTPAGFRMAIWKSTHATCACLGMDIYYTNFNIVHSRTESSCDVPCMHVHTH